MVKKMQELKKQIQSVVDAYKTQNFAKAESLCKKLIVTNPKVVFLYNLFGLILSGQKKIDESIEYFKKGIEIDPNFAIIYNNLGLSFFNQKSNNYIEKAEKSYKKSISTDHTLAEPHNNLGTLYNSLSKYKEAIECYNKALELNPKFYYTHNNLGSVHLALGNFDNARRHFEASIKINPNYLNPHRSLSRMTRYTRSNKHFLELLKIYEKININEKENKMDIAFALGKAYDDINDYDEAFKYFLQANQISNEKANFLINRG